jgi:hypothetical protein
MCIEWPVLSSTGSLRGCSALPTLACFAAQLVASAGGTQNVRFACRKEARKAKLRDTAGSMKKTGEDKQTFKDAEYSVSEEARTPNIHSRQVQSTVTMPLFRFGGLNHPIA